ncbi:MAG: NAD(+) diphosphatase [Ideonella sp.]|nr:NAD(+) diphosphatase [Ideonella sp.]MCC7455440.1 NAD(+) diphosphatase [Nitrospira sp.]
MPQFIPAIAPIAPSSAVAWCFAFVEGQLLLPEGRAEAGLAPQPWSCFEPMRPARHFLGRIDGVDCWAFTLEQPPAGFRRVPLRAAMMSFDDTLMGVAGRAAQVLEWDRAHRYCGVCGTPTELQAHERARKCPRCGHSAYPRLSPAMMVLVWRAPAGGPRQVLLARSPHYVPGVYSALAGFVEPGESLEQCVHREVAEEVGVRVDHLRYYGSQSWPFPHSLMVAYTAEWVGGEIVRQEDEIEDAQWYTIDALPPIPPRFSISGHLIRDTVVAMGAAEPGGGTAAVR